MLFAGSLPSSAFASHRAFGTSGASGLISKGTRSRSLAAHVLMLLVEQLDELERHVVQVDAEIRAWHRANPVSQRLAKIPGVGPLIASAIVATVADASVFRSGREFAAWLGLVPRQRSTGGKQRLGRITHQGDAYIRRLLIIGAQSALQRSKEIRRNAWVQGLLGRCARLKVAVALANKTARIAWALMARGGIYHQPACLWRSLTVRIEMLARGRDVME